MSGRKMPKISSLIEKLGGRKEKTKEEKTKEEETREEEIKFWEQGSFWWWIVTAIVIIILTITTLPLLMPKVPWWQARILLRVLVWIAVIIGLPVWLIKNFKQIGTVDIPSQAVLARWGKPVTAVPPGLFFGYRPIEEFKEFPTGQYSMEYTLEEGLYTKADKGKKLASQPVKLILVIYLRWPMVGKDYSFPMPKDKAQEKDEEGDNEGLRKGLFWGRIRGRELLKKAFLRLPIRNLMPKNETEAIKIAEKLRSHFEGGVLGAARQIIANKTSEECKEKQPDLEKEIKIYLLSEEGNPFFEIGIPKECLDVEIKSLKLPKEIEDAYLKPEIKKKDEEAAIHEKEAILRKLEAYLEKGVPEAIAGLLVGGVEGKAMTFDQLRDLAIFSSLGGFPRKETEKEQIMSALRKFSKEDLEKLLKSVKK